MLKQIKGKLKEKARHKKEILINIEPLETRVAVLDERKLDNFHIEREDDNRIVGSIFKGKMKAGIFREGGYSEKHAQFDGTEIVNSTKID